MMNFEDTRFQETENYRTDLAEVFKQSDTNFNIAATIVKVQTDEIVEDYSQYVKFVFSLTNSSRNR